MILCIDIGNTNCVFGVFENDSLLTCFRLESKLSQTIDEYGVKVLELLKFHNLERQKIEGVIISSVVPPLDGTFEKMLVKYFNLKPLFVGPGTKTGVRISVDNPKQVGADIIVGAVASIQKYGTPTIIIDMGTAITLFYVDDKKELVGGVIAPGIRTGFGGLFKNTARLEEVKLHQPPSVIGRDTVSCIQSAMVHGTSAMIDGLIRKIKKEIGIEKINVVLTGGESRLIQHFLEEEVIYDEDLLMEGLNIIYKKNQ
ncbi:MAG: type III pantothenate kinase [Bacilli bacterium]|nr:type III pantothenate kinase [Bacilli bacterium]